MMFNKELFLSLCEKYHVELSNTATEPMIRKGEEVHPLSKEEIRFVFSSGQNTFDYSIDKSSHIPKSELYSLTEKYALAC